MDKGMTIWRVFVAAFAVWRLSRLFLVDKGLDDRPRSLRGQKQKIFGNRIPGWIPDCVCWLSVWLSGQTAIWVAGGLAAVFLNWLALASLSRLLMPPCDTAYESLLSLTPPVQLRTEPLNGDFSCLTFERSMQANNG